jgi:hypothetical protein
MAHAGAGRRRFTKPKNTQSKLAARAADPPNSLLQLMKSTCTAVTLLPMADEDLFLQWTAVAAPCVVCQHQARNGNAAVLKLVATARMAGSRSIGICAIVMTDLA